MPDSATDAQVRWAHSYDGYRRLATGPEMLATVLKDRGRLTAAKVESRTGAVWTCLEGGPST